MPSPEMLFRGADETREENLISASPRGWLGLPLIVIFITFLLANPLNLC
jgi:hypothetical protein